MTFSIDHAETRPQPGAPSWTAGYPADWPYSSVARAERVVALSRVVLAVFSTFSVWLASHDAPAHSHLAVLLIAGYACYSLLLAAFAWTYDAVSRRYRLVTHILDLAFYTAIITLTEGVTSPFFVYLVFSVLCGTLRWQWRGTLNSAIAAIGAYFGVGFFSFHVLHDPTFELDRFVLRSVNLSVIAGVLTYVGAHEQQVRSEIRRLADWPRTLRADTASLLRELLAHATDVMAVPRLAVVFEEPEEPWQHVAVHANGAFSLRREPPDRYTPLVAAGIGAMPFIGRDVSTAGAHLVLVAGESLQDWHGPAINPRLVADLGMRAVLAIPLPGDRLSGWLFCLDKARPSVDDVALGTICARELIASLDHAELLARERETAAVDERTRLGRDLHDGLLQSLTAARLQLHRLVRQAAGAGMASREKLEAVEASITANQRELRRIVEELRPGDEGDRRDVVLAESLGLLRQGMRKDWGLDVTVRVDASLPFSPSLGREVQLMIHEALVNAVRHGGASSAGVSVSGGPHHLTLTVADNGRGFPFQGRRDQLQLAREQLGPVSLRERVMALNGTLVVESGPSGATLEMTLPLGERC